MHRTTTLIIRDPQVDTWLKQQTQMSQSIEILIKEHIERHGGEMINMTKSNALPTSSAFVDATLRALSDGRQKAVDELYVAVSEDLGLSDDAVSQQDTVSGDNSYQKRVRFSLLTLKNEGLVENIARGVYRITDLGRFAAKNALSLNDLGDLAVCNYIQKITSQNN